jgi:hypothetical protein
MILKNLDGNTYTYTYEDLEALRKTKVETHFKREHVKAELILSIEKIIKWIKHSIRS